MSKLTFKMYFCLNPHSIELRHFGYFKRAKTRSTYWEWMAIMNISPFLDGDPEMVRAEEAVDMPVFLKLESIGVHSMQFVQEPDAQVHGVYQTHGLRNDADTLAELIFIFRVLRPSHGSGRE